MANNYYGTIAALAWVFGHYFYKQEHYVWLAKEYYPYRLPNPKSSNPHLIYQDLYQPWKDKDDYDKYIQQVRLKLRAGVIAKEAAGVITTTDASELKNICDKVDIVFLYPIVLRVNLGVIAPTRQKRKNSAVSAGSSEVLVEDLKESEMEIIFLDYETDPDFKTLVVDEITKTTTTTYTDSMNKLKGRC
jgi:hypothetical protein